MENFHRALSLLSIATIAASMVVMAQPKAVVDAQTPPPVPQFTLRFVNDTLIMTFMSPAPVEPSHGFLLSL